MLPVLIILKIVIGENRFSLYTVSAGRHQISHFVRSDFSEIAIVLVCFDFRIQGKKDTFLQLN
jgi:hypothetical protein